MGTAIMGQSGERIGAVSRENRDSQVRGEQPGATTDEVQGRGSGLSNQGGCGESWNLSS